MHLNWTSANIRALVLFFLLLTSCYKSTELRVVPDYVSPQEQFVSRLYEKNLVMVDTIGLLLRVIENIESRAELPQRFQTNSPFDSTCLNFYIIDSHLDSTYYGLCAFAGNNVIVLDGNFLYNSLQKTKRDLVSIFQQWVISHEVAHAALGHQTGHFINDGQPKTQPEARQFHTKELNADRLSRNYIPDTLQADLEKMLVVIFNTSYREMYGDGSSTFNYLRHDPDPTLIYPYKLDGSHPTMAIRASLYIYMTTSNKRLKAEALQFLTQSQLHYLRELIDVPIAP